MFRTAFSHAFAVFLFTELAFHQPLLALEKRKLINIDSA